MEPTIRRLLGRARFNAYGCAGAVLETVNLRAFPAQPKVPDAHLGFQGICMRDRLGKPDQTALAIIKGGVAHGIAALHGYRASIELRAE